MIFLISARIVSYCLIEGGKKASKCFFEHLKPRLYIPENQAFMRVRGVLFVAPLKNNTIFYYLFNHYQYVHFLKNKNQYILKLF